MGLKVKYQEGLFKPLKKGKLAGGETEIDTYLMELAAQQGVSVTTNFDNLFGDFWPEDESTDDFILAVKEWRHEDND